MKYWIVVHDFINFKENPDLIGITAKKNKNTNEFIQNKEGSFVPRFEQYKGVLINPKIDDKIVYYCPKDYRKIIGLFEIIKGPDRYIDDWETPIQYKIKEITPINSENYISYNEMIDNLDFFKDEATGKQFTGHSAANKIHGPIKPIDYKDFNWIFKRYTGSDFPKPFVYDVEKSQRQLDNLRIKQVEFQSSILELEKEYQDLNKLRRQFKRKFAIKDILNMSMKDYVVGFGADNESFCYWLETKLMNLGKIKGGSTAEKKFGVYYSKDDKKYISIPKFSTNVEEAFIKIKNEINNLIIAGKEEDIDAIKSNEISPMFKGKILSTYFPDIYLNVFSQSHLEHFLDKLEIHYNESNDVVDKRMLLMDFKSNDEIMKEWNNFLFMKFLYYSYSKPTAAKFVPKVLNEYSDSKDEYPKMKNVKPENIDLTIIPKISKSPSRTRKFKGKTDFERENRIKHNLGKRGELIVMKLEEEFLLNKNLKNLADKIEHVSLENDSLGYDIISFDENGKKKFIEVKATTNSPSLNVNFIISSNQLKVAKDTENYYFYIVFDAKSVNPKVWELKNPIEYKEKGLTLTPINYRVIINTDDK